MAIDYIMTVVKTTRLPNTPYLPIPKARSTLDRHKPAARSHNTRPPLIATTRLTHLLPPYYRELHKRPLALVIPSHVNMYRGGTNSASVPTRRCNGLALYRKRWLET